MMTFKEKLFKFTVIVRVTTKAYFTVEYTKVFTVRMLHNFVLERNDA